jgi:hypothetical protein
MRKSGAAPRVGPRAHPADRAIAVYGVVPATFAGRRYVVDGRRTIIVPSGRVGLVANYVDPAEFAPEAVERRRVDRTWLRERAAHHERVLERLHARGSVLPTPLLTTYEDIGALESAVRKSATRWSRALARVTGKVEYGLHVFTGPHALPPLEPYVLRVSQRAQSERRSSRAQAAPSPEATPLAEHLQRLWESCGAAAESVRRFHAPDVRGFAFGAALLLDERADAALRMAFTALEPAGHLLGVTVYLEGPRLPFTFS